MGKHISIKGEMNKLDEEEKKQKEIEASAARLRSMLGAYDAMDPAEQRKILDAMDPDGSTRRNMKDEGVIK